MTWLITGAGGFLGRHLAEALVTDGVEVHGTVRTLPAAGFDAVASVTYHECDVRDAERVSAVVSAVQPSTICHLAAQSSPSGSWGGVKETFDTNVGGSVNVLDAIRAGVPEALVLAVGSSAQYGTATRAMTEEHPQLPATPYGVTKAAQDRLVVLYGEHFGLRTVRLRPFFIVGSRKTGDVTSDLARRVVEVERGATRTVTVGNLDAVRDMLDVRDAVAAVRMIAERADTGSVFNLCSGVGRPIHAVLDAMIAVATVPVSITADPALLRPSEESARVGDNARLRALGWSPLISFERMVADVLDHWRHEARGLGSPSARD